MKYSIISAVILGYLGNAVILDPTRSPQDLKKYTHCFVKLNR